MELNKVTLAPLRPAEGNLQIQAKVLGYTQVPAYIQHNGALTFDNQLGKVADVSFFRMENKDGTLIPNFCNGNENPLWVRVGDLTVCMTASDPGVYAYSVKVNTYDPLDPVIVLGQLDIAIGPLVIGGVAIALVGFLLGRSWGKRIARKQPW